MMKKESISSFGTILASLLAASSCIGPVLFIVFGTSVGFLGKLSFMMPLKPYLLAAAFLMLGYSFRKLYLKKTDCTDSACVEDPRARKIARGIFWIAFVTLVFAASFQKIIVWVYG